jgi:hypothetical protein
MTSSTKGRTQIGINSEGPCKWYYNNTTDKSHGKEKKEKKTAKQPANQPTNQHKDTKPSLWHKANR